MASRMHRGHERDKAHQDGVDVIVDWAASYGCCLGDRGSGWGHTVDSCSSVLYGLEQGGRHLLISLWENQQMFDVVDLMLRIFSPCVR